MTKKIFSIIGTTCFLAFSFTGYAAKLTLDDAPKLTSHLDKIVAIVNGDVITKNELNKRIELIKHQLAATNETKISHSELRKRALDSMIDTLLQLKMAENNNIKVSDAELDGIINNIAKSNNLTLEQLKKSLAEQENLSFKEYREQLRDQILISRLQQRALGKDIIISEKEIEQVLRNPPKFPTYPTIYHTLDIIINTPDNASPEQIKNATKIATEIATKLKQGKDLEKLIQEYNAADHNISSMDLGWRKIDELPNLFTKEVVKLKAGQISNPIQAPNGFHILKLIEVHGAKPRKFDRPQAEEMLFQKKLQERVKSWIAKDLREPAYIKIFE